MTTMTCEQVRDLLELHALGECEADVARDLDQHLAACPACQQEQESATRLVGLLDDHFRAENGLARLQGRLRMEAKSWQRPRSVLPFVRRFVAAAAVVLIALMLGRWFERDAPPDEPQLVAELRRDRAEPPGVEAAFHAMVAAAKTGREQLLADALLKFTFARRDSGDLRNELRLASRDGLPLGPSVGLHLTLTNEGKQPVWLDVGSERTMLRLDLRGPGVFTLFGKAKTKPPFLEQKLLKLAPGQQFILPIPHLIGGRPDVQEAAYWTKPGHYTLAVLYRVRVLSGPTRDSDGVDRIFHGPPIVLDVEEK